MKGYLPWHNPEAAPRRGARHGLRHVYGVRSVRCSCCSKLFRREDVKQGICAWCAWERLPVWQKHLEMTDL